jgi:hypothetical protein
MTKATIKRAPSKLACNWPSVSGLAEGKSFGHFLHSINVFYHSHRRFSLVITGKDTKSICNSHHFPQKKK